MLKTPLYDIHLALNAKISPFGGWLMPIQYSGIIEEHNWTRAFCGLFDICHMGEFIVEADLANCNLGNLLTVDLANMPLCACRYGFILNQQGGIIDDLLVYKISQTKWMIVLNAATTDSDYAYLQNHLTGAMRFENVSASLGKLDLQGPFAMSVLTKFLGADITALQYYTFNYFNLLGEKIIISRTGYTGELGYELYMPVGLIPELWRKILEDKRVKPVGLGARDTLRLEMGYALYGQDIDEHTTPLEAGLKNFIPWDKEFIGKAVLLKQNQVGTSRRMVYFVADSRRSPRHNYRILYNREDIGSVTSGSFSPSLGFGIGMGYVSRQIAPGDEIMLQDAAVSINAKVVNKPFYNNGTAKCKEIKHVYTG